MTKEKADKLSDEFMTHLKKKLGSIVVMVPPKYIQTIRDEVSLLISVIHNEAKNESKEG
jgi:hypothetical protein